MNEITSQCMNDITTSGRNDITQKSHSQLSCYPEMCAFSFAVSEDVLVALHSLSAHFLIVSHSVLFCSFQRLYVS